MGDGEVVLRSGPGENVQQDGARIHTFGIGGSGWPRRLVRSKARLLGGSTSILVGNAVVRDPITLEAGIPLGDLLSPMLSVFATSL